MSELTILDSKVHKDYKVEPTNDFSFARKDNLCSILIAEIPNILEEAPIVFAKDENSVFQLCSLQGLDQNQNYFVSENGTWKGTYIPTKYRSYPFQMAFETNSQKKVLCFEKTSNLVVKNPSSKGKPLFNENSEPSDHTKQILKFLNSVDQNQTATAEAVKAIVEADLLQDLQLKIKNVTKDEKTPEEKVITGIKRINISKFESTNTKTLKNLKDSGALIVIFGHLFSINKLQKLAVLLKKDTSENYVSHKDRAVAKRAEETKLQTDNLVQNLLLDD